MPAMTPVPDGFTPLPPASPFNGLVGPLYEKPGERRVSLGLRVEDKHCNSRGF
jgi:hypothetical protein